MSDVEQGLNKLNKYLLQWLSAIVVNMLKKIFFFKVNMLKKFFFFQIMKWLRRARSAQILPGICSLGHKHVTPAPSPHFSWDLCQVLSQETLLY